MLSERMQILMTPEQREHLEDLAKQRDTSVGALVREAVDAHVQTAVREERLAAARWFAEVQLPMTDEEMDRAIAEAEEDRYRDVLPPEDGE